MFSGCIAGFLLFCDQTLQLVYQTENKEFSTNNSLRLTKLHANALQCFAFEHAWCKDITNVQNHLLLCPHAEQ